MFVATTYLLTALTVWALLVIAGRQRHQGSGDVEVFRYPAVYRYFFAGSVPFFVLAGLYSTVLGGRPPHPFPGEWIFSAITCSVFCALGLYGYLWMSRYSILVSGISISVRSVFTARSFTADQIQSITVLNGYRGARDVFLRDADGRLLMRVGGTIEDFDELVSLLRAKTKGRDVVFRQRDSKVTGQ